MKELITPIKPEEALKKALAVVKEVTSYSGLHLKLYRSSNGRGCINYQVESFPVRFPMQFEKAYVQLDKDIQSIMTGCGVLQYEMEMHEVIIGKDENSGRDQCQWYVDMGFDINIIMSGGEH